MDKITAGRMADELAGSEIGGWKILGKINNGKSAVVLKAERNGQHGAVKVYDREMVERCGADVQEKRGIRERSLVGRNHPNLVKMLDAGHDAKLNYFFTVMELLPWKNLAEVLKDIPVGYERALIRQVARAAHFLEAELNMAHRDIKPENIGISDDFKTVKLLDLGVLKPIDSDSSLTDDGSSRRFIATRQYSPPELLYRTEHPSLEGWRAVTFYQLGGVLHDLLARRPLFADELEPPAVLQKAIDTKIVTFDASVDPDLRALAQDALVKHWETRLDLVKWDRFQEEPPKVLDKTALLRRIQGRQRSAMAAQLSTPPRDKSHELQLLAKRLDDQLRDATESINGPTRAVTHWIEDDVAFIRVVYAASATYATSHPFALFIEATITNLESGTVHVRGAAAIAREDLPQRSDPTWLRTIFEGVDDEDLIRQRFEMTVAQYWEAATEIPSDSVSEARELQPTAGGQ